MGLCLSVVVVAGVDNKQTEAHSEYESILPQIKLTPSEDRNGMSSVPVELQIMSSFSINVKCGIKMDTISEDKCMCLCLCL